MPTAATLFVSDLHLSAERPDIAQIFFDFLKKPALEADALYILGDLFEYWIGDDDDDAFHAQVLAALHALAARGVKTYFMHGNRDFLTGARFTQRSGAQLIADPTLIDLYGQPTLLMHGDTLCTDDVRYQEYRARMHNPLLQRLLLALPLFVRKRIATGLRAQSQKAKAQKSEEIMDVAPAAVDAILREYHYPRLIHGHTHRPARHEHVVDGHVCERWVLADWYQRGSYLRCDAKSCTSIPLP